MRSILLFVSLFLLILMLSCSKKAENSNIQAEKSESQIKTNIQAETSIEDSDIPLEKNIADNPEAKPNDETPSTAPSGMAVNSEASDSVDADQNICDNAQNYGLCDGLNIAFKQGYKEACCSNFNLCC